MKTRLFLFLLFSSVLLSAQSRRTALLDMTARNSETTDGNRFSAQQLLTIAGLDYFQTTDVNAAATSAFILCSSSIESNSFSQAERDTLKAFVSRGGILIATNVKDTALYALFGVSGYSYSVTRHNLNWMYYPGDLCFRWIRDPYELSLRLGDSSNVSIYGTRGYTTTTGQPKAFFEDMTGAVVVNSYNSGFTYLFGLSWKDVVLRNEQERHYDAARSYSNGFEPQTDVFALFIRGTYMQHIPFATWKHTSGLNSTNTVIITHDVDATTGMGMMNDFAGYEKSNTFRATYFITTHYMHDSLAKDFYTNFTDTMRMLCGTGMEIGSHSVSHVPDFDDTAVVHFGSSGNDEYSYQPFWNGHYSSGVTVYGEAEVSKMLLERDLGVYIRAYRTGYLAFNRNLVRGLEDNQYSFNCSHSANNVLTAFPFQSHYGLSMDSAISTVYEIPNTISDVFMDDPISESNYTEKAATWTDVQLRNGSNGAVTSLLIHPNRLWKIDAEQIFLHNLLLGTRIRTVNEFGDYWIAREQCSFTTQLVDDSILYVTIDSASLPLNYELSFIVNNGQHLSQIIVQDQQGNIIPMLQSNWYAYDKILHSRTFSETYDQFYFQYDQAANSIAPYPNPFTTTTEFELDLNEASPVTLKIFDMTGRLVRIEMDQVLNVGHHDIILNGAGLDQGTYIYELTVNGKRTTGKMIMTGN